MTMQLVLQTASVIQTYASGAVPGAFTVTVPLAVERPLLFYPFDAYSTDLVSFSCSAAVCRCGGLRGTSSALQHVQPKHHKPKHHERTHVV
jgi:hypothetical protein